APATSPVSALERRVVARVDRLLEELLLVLGPELADVFVGLDGLVPILETVFGAFLAKLADVEVSDHVAEVIEFDGATWRVGQLDRAHRGHQLGLVAGVTAERFEAGFDNLAVDIEQ